uniref:Mediator of RNA polymerase II transcription subunit 19 n=1 Tax=Caenorhabditis tropicalis TaxID=1561998 RepID=A0A1I7U8I0_9PELO
MLNKLRLGMNEPTTSSGLFKIGNNATPQNLKDEEFYALKQYLPQYSEIQGNHDLLTAHGLGPVEGNFSGSRRVKEKLSSFLPHIIGEFHPDATKETSSLKGLIEKPPIHKEL